MTPQVKSTPEESRIPTATDTAFARILQVIQDQNLRPGDQIPSESKLAEEFGVGRGAVREAVRSLAQLGILKVQNGRRAEVSEVSGQNLAILINHAIKTSQVSVLQTWEFRQTIETRIVRLAALRRTPEQVANMRAICTRMMAVRTDLKALTRADIDLHQAWAVAAGNPLYLLNMQSLEIVMDWTGPIGYAAFDDDEAIKAHINLHFQITEAIDAKKSDVAQKKMLDHFDQARTCLLDAGFM